MKTLALLLALPLAAMAAPLDKTIDAMLTARFKPTLPGVAALVLKDGRPVLRTAHGMASLELGVPLKPSHVFRIGSTTKLFAATALMLLVEEGKVALDAPVSRYLPDTPPHWQGVTIEHLLTHTSGIPNMTMVSGYWRTTARLDHTLAELLAPVRDQALEFDPGTRFVYNNSGYVLLAMVIEKVSGQEFFDFVHTRISTPLGLAHTGSGSSKAITPGLVTGYQRGPSPERFIAAVNLSAAGGMVSTVDDLGKFMLALQQHKLLGKKSVERMNTPYVLANGEATEYGLGMWIRTVNGHKLVGHGGYIHNFYSQLEMDIDASIVAITLHNGDRFGGDNEYLSKRMIAAVQGKPIPDPVPATLTAEQLARLAGTYGAQVVRIEDGKLTRLAGGHKTVLVPSSPTTFFDPDGELRLRFVLADGRAASIQRYEDGGKAGPVLTRSAE